MSAAAPKKNKAEDDDNEDGIYTHLRKFINVID